MRFVLCELDLENCGKLGFSDGSAGDYDLVVGADERTAVTAFGTAK